MATATDEITEIRRRMADIRRELHEDVREVVASAEAVADWHRYIRMYPWAAVGVAFAVGYVVVPKRKHTVTADVATQAELARMREAVVNAMPPKEEVARKSLLAAAVSGVVGMVGPLVWRLTQNYALNYAEQWLAQQQQQYMAAGPAPAAPPPGPSQPRSAGGPGRPGGF